jgi:hypothetical protein
MYIVLNTCCFCFSTDLLPHIVGQILLWHDIIMNDVDFFLLHNIPMQLQILFSCHLSTV